MADEAPVIIPVEADTAGMERQIATGADKAGTEAGKTFSKKAKVGLVALGAGLGGVLGGVAAVFKTGIDEQKDFLAGQAQLANGIKTTGNAAGVSVDQLEDLASSIQNYSGQTDDSIVASEKLLLTFTGIKNTAGKNNDIFNQATKATADMAAKMGGDASASAIQLGKALNDPVMGVTALSKIGVSFTQKQKDLITQLVKTGDVAGGQKVILAELNKEFGGSAKAAGSTLPGQLTRAKRAFEDVSQSVLQALMPVLTGLGNFLTKNVLPAFSKLVNWIIQYWPKVQAVIISVFQKYVLPVLKVVVAFFMTQVLPAFKTVINWIVEHWPEIQKVFVFVWKTIQPIFKAIGQLLQAVWNSIIKPFVKWIQDHWGAISTVFKIVAVAVAVAFKIWAVAWTVVFKLLTVGVKIIGAIFNTLSDIIGIAINAIVGVFKFFQLAWQATYTAVVAVINLLVAAWRGMWAFVQAAWTSVGKPVFDFIVAAIKVYIDGLVLVFNGIVTAFKAVWTAIQAVYNAVVVPIWETIKAAIKLVASAFSTALNGISRAWSAIWNGLGKAFSAAWATVKGIISGALGGVWKIISGVADKIFSVWDGIWNYLSSTVSTAISGITSTVSGIWDGITGGLKAVLHGAINIINTVIHGINKGLNLIPFVDLTIPDIPNNFRDGGLAQGAGTGRSDSIVARVSNGEFVVNSKATADNLPLLNAINSGKSITNPAGGYATSQSVSDTGQTVVNQNFYGPTTSADRRRELEWTLRFATR